MCDPNIYLKLNCMLPVWCVTHGGGGSFSPLQAQHAGGVITEEDFSNYSALLEKPVCGVYRGDLSTLAPRVPTEEKPPSPWPHPFGLVAPPHFTREKLRQ